MQRVLVAFSKTELCKAMVDTLVTGGISVRGSMRSGAEVKRVIQWMDGGVVVCGSRLSDMSVMELASDLGDSALLLVVASPAQLDNMDPAANVFSLPSPARNSELVASVRLLMQLDEKQAATHITKKTDEEKALIAQAKELLMEKRGMSEPEAHRYIQQKSMAAGVKTSQTAKELLQQLQ